MEISKKELFLSTRNITKKYKKAMVLRDVTMNVPKNCIYGLLGPNGAGKSTIMKIMAGLIKQTSGEIFIGNHKWDRSFLAETGALIETPPLYSHLTARENLKVHTTLLGLPHQSIDEVLAIVNLTDTHDKIVKHFSMGMKQRLGIATAIINKPKLLILDEPTNGLDPIGIQELRTLIKTFPQKGMTVIVSSHILSEIQLVADHVGIICQGRLAFEGENNDKINLESLFMEVVSKTQKGRLV